MKKRAESREGMTVTTVALPRDLYRRLAVAAIEENAAVTELVRQAVAEWLDRRRPRHKGRRK
jgi:predicted transcriptional regulator